IRDALRRWYRATRSAHDDTTINFLAAIVPNPFAGLIPGQTLNGATTSRGQILRPFPEFTSIATERYDGWAIYHGGQFRLERRFVRGFTLLTSYTWSKTIEKTTFLND